MNPSPISTSGAGFDLEHYVQSSYLASLILGTPIPLSENLYSISLKFQGRRIAQTDDLIVELQNGASSETHFIQSKKGFEVNDNKIFNDLIATVWEDFNNTSLFNPETDKFIVTTDPLSRTEITNTLVLLDWARFSSDENDFFSKVLNEKSKAAKLNYFISAIEKAKGCASTNFEIFHFLKCFYIQDYDYLIQGGKDKEVLKWYLKPYLINGIDSEHALSQLLKYIFQCNQNQATLTKENVNIKIKELFLLTVTDKLSNELKKILKNSVQSLEHSISNDIQGYHIDRSQLAEKVIETIASNKITILEGEAGVGKSGLLKDLSLKLYNNHPGYIYLKADVLDRNTLAESLAAIGITTDFETLASQWVLLPKLIIYIDSFEKLYESEKKGAFFEFIGLIQNFRKIKIVVACRKYAVNDLIFKYKLKPSEIGVKEIPEISDEELEEIVNHFPSLSPLKAQPKLKRLIKKPFYLSIAVQIAENLPSGVVIDETAFKNKLWEILIEKRGNSSAGISAKRSSAFISIVLKRAKEKKPFVEPDNLIDPAILDGLLIDELLIKHATIYAFAPAHDILEDLAVTRHINTMYINKENTSSFIQGLEFYPVLRRGIRLWINEQMDCNIKEITQFIQEVLKSEHSNQFIKDEILLSILSSDECAKFLDDNSELFIADNFGLLERLILLLNVAFTDDYKGTQHQRITKTFGYGWNATIAFIDKNYNKFPKGYDLRFIQILDKASLQFEIGEPLPDEAKLIANHCLRIIATPIPGVSVNLLLSILFRVADVTKSDIDKMLNSAITAKEQRSTNEINIPLVRSLFKMVLLETNNCINLYRLFPDLIIKIAHLEWYKDPKSELDFGHDADYMERCWGLNSYPYKYFNASAYQTPFRYLLKYHPDKAIDFFIEMLNRGVQYYSLSDYSKQNETKLIRFQLEDGSYVEQLGDFALWAIYRGNGHVPDLIVSIHMALEEFLMNCVEEGNDIRAYAKKLLQSTKCVSATSLLASVAMRYPFSIGKEILSIIKVREFFAWDLSRYAAETVMNLSALGNDRYYVEERQNSNKLKFRQTNMESLVSNLQLYGIEEASKIIDDHKIKADQDDRYWLLALQRMDIRNSTPIYKEEQGILEFNPNPLPENLQDFIDEGKNDQDKFLTNISAFLWAEKALKGELEEDVKYSQWKKYYKQAIQMPDNEVLLGYGDPKPKLGALGIRDFLNELTIDEKTFCVNQIHGISDSICEGYRNFIFDSNSVDILHRNILEVFPILLWPELTDYVKGEFKSQILEHLIFLRDEPKGILASGINKYLWIKNPEFAKECVHVLFNLHCSGDLHQKVRDILQSQHNKTISEEDFSELISEYISWKDSINIDRLELNIFNTVYLLQAIKAIPYSLINSTYFEFFKTVIEKSISYQRSDKMDNYDFFTGLEYYLGRYFIDNTTEKAKEILQFLLVNLDHNPTLVLNILKIFIAYGHDNNYPENLWNHFISIALFISEHPFTGLINALLFTTLKDHIRCNKLPENGFGKNIHQLLIENFISDSNVMPQAFKLLSGIGSVYQPFCLVWLKKGIPTEHNLRRGFSRIDITGRVYLESFVEQIYTNHLDYLYKNSEIKEYYRIYLDVLIDYGSTLAFRIREDLI